MYFLLPDHFVRFPFHSPKSSLRAGGTHLAVLGRSLAAYLYTALETADVDKAAAVISGQTTRLLTSIFKWTL